MTTTYTAQRKTSTGWITVAERTDAHQAASQLWDDMQRAGFRYGELAAHCADLAAGHTLTAEGGTEFRVLPSTPTYRVVTVWNTDANGEYVGDVADEADLPRSLSQPFQVEADAIAYMNDLPDDTDVRDMFVEVQA